MTTHLHDLIANVAQGDPAIHVSEQILVNLITNRLEKALQKFVGFYRPYPDRRPIVQIGLKACTYNRTNANWHVDLPPAGAQPGTFAISSSVGFDADFAVVKVDDVNVELFTVKLSVRAVNAFGAIDNNRLSILTPLVDSSTLLAEDPNYDDHLRQCGLNDAQVKRLEGLVEGSVVPALFSKIFSGAPAIDLASLFPMISFDGPAELDMVDRGLLIVARSGSHLNQSACCPCGVATPPIIMRPGQATPHPDPSTGGTLPINVTIPPPGTQTPETNVDGQLSIFLPQPTIESMSGGPYPAIAGYFDDNGFIGYSLDYSIAFLSGALSLSDPRATLVIKLEFYVTGHGEVNVDIPCVGRSPIGRFWTTNRQNQSILEVGISPVLSGDGKLSLKGELLSLTVGDFKVDTVTVASWLLSYLTASGGLIGFVFDQILSRVIAHNLPSQLSHAIDDIMGKLNWTIFDLTKFDLGIAGDLMYGIRPAVSRAPQSALFGFELDRG